MCQSVKEVTQTQYNLPGDRIISRGWELRDERGDGSEEEIRVQRSQVHPVEYSLIVPRYRNLENSKQKN